MKSQKKEFLEILEKYQGILHKVSLIYCRNETERKDNFQEIVYQLWKSFPKLKKKESIGSWIYAVAINTSIAQFKKRIKTDNYDKVPEIEDAKDFFADLTFDEDVQRLLSAIAKLNEIDKSIMLLYLEEKTYDEIASILGISASNVGVRINRAKKVLKQYLK